MAYTPANDFDASPCGYEVPPGLEVDFDRACLPGSTRLNLCGPTGVTALVLGCYSEPAEEPAEDVEVTVGSQTRKPTAAVGISKSRDATISARTRTPTLLAIVGKVTRTDVAARTRTPTLTARVVPVPKVTVGATTRRPRLNADLAYDPNLLSDVVALTTETWRAGDRVPHSAAEAWQERLPSFVAGIGAWSPAQALSGPAVPSWRGSERVAGDGFGRWRAAGSALGGARDGWLQAPREIRFSFDRWREGLRLDGQGQGQWHPGPPHYHEADRSPDPPNDFHGITLADYPPHRLEVDFPGVYAWAARKGRGLGRRDGWRDADRVSSGRQVGGLRDGPFLPSQSLPKWNDGRLVPYIWRVVPEPPGPGDDWEHWGNDLCLWRPLDAPLDLGVLPGCPGPEPGLIIPRRRTYIVVHDIEVVRLPDRYPIACAALAISLDADAWAWSWSGTLLGAAALEAVLPVDDEPVTIEASIDGYLWHLLVEEWSEDRAFGSRAIRASGRGLTAWLAAPYQLPGSGVLANARTIQQLMDEHLPLGEGWTLVWRDGTPDWLIPAGAWSWAQRTPMQAIHEAALGVGLVVLPARTARELHVLPRYPVLPWDYATATPDLEIPDAAILQLTRRRQADAQANAVYVHGAEVGGLLARVYRTGSAGDRLASTESHPLITHVDGARLFGSRILAAHESQPEVRSITLPLGGDFPLPELGQLVSVELGAADIRGTISGLEVAVQRSGGEALTVRQTITLGEEAPNLWARFRSLLPVDPLLAGEATILHGDGTVTVTLIGGGTIRVRGEAAQGQMVYIRGGRIEGEAPDLTGYEIEV